jgi:NADH dehydrogenase [ubiquinone] 1 alpha subcomplex assembly factor 5
MGDIEEYDLIISNMKLHWFNDIETALNDYKASLLPDGAFISTSLGGDSLQELRICLNLAEQERDGGISPRVSPFLSVTELGNIFAKCRYNLPTIDSVHSQMEFTNMLSLVSFLSIIGEQSALFEVRPGVMSLDTIIAASALFETLFNKKTIG